MTEMPDWREAEHNCADILAGCYSDACVVERDSGGDPFHFADVMATHPTAKPVMVQVKDRSSEMGMYAIRGHHRSIKDKVSGDHWRVEVWQRHDGQWKVDHIPVSSPIMMERTGTTLPLNVPDATDAYADYVTDRLGVTFEQWWDGR